ncbi:DUF6247 family protein [Streptomyces sp. NPDC051561]|uniref:DUF6247 family protein n=1 Tax=Streptomyces sp. NPDC051561 TaxID=3365658 RepID=UPI00378D600E
MSVRPEDADGAERAGRTAVPSAGTTPAPAAACAPDAAAVPAAAPAPAAAAQLLARIRTDRRAAQWGPAFERDWGKALEDARHSYSLAPLHEVIRTWQSRLDTAPAVDAFLDSGMDDSQYVALGDILGR